MQRIGLVVLVLLTVCILPLKICRAAPDDVLYETFNSHTGELDMIIDISSDLTFEGDVQIEASLSLFNDLTVTNNAYFLPLGVIRDNGGDMEFSEDGGGTWTDFGGGTPGGADTNVQYNNGGAFGGESAFVYDDSLNALFIHDSTLADYIYFRHDGTGALFGNLGGDFDFVPANDIRMGVADNDTTVFGASKDATIEFDGDSLNITADAVGAGDNLELTANQIKLLASLVVIGEGGDDYSMPVGDGAASQIMSTNGSGAVTWGDPPSSSEWSDDDATLTTADANRNVQIDADLIVMNIMNAATILEGGNAVYNSSETPGGELGGTWASPTVDSGIHDDEYQPLESTLTDIADGTINENLVNTANPWADNEVANDITIDLAATATALAANGANAAAGNAILGVDASGAAEGSFDVWTEAENTAAEYIASESDTLDDVVGRGNWTDDLVNVKNNLSISNNLSVHNDLYISNNVSIDQHLTIDGQISTNSKVILRGDGGSKFVLPEDAATLVLLPNNGSKVYPFRADVAIGNTGLAFDYANSLLTVDRDGSTVFAVNENATPYGTVLMRTYSQTGEPTTTQCPTGYMCWWIDTDGGPAVYLCRNAGGTVVTVQLT